MALTFGHNDLDLKITFALKLSLISLPNRTGKEWMQSKGIHMTSCMTPIYVYGFVSKKSGKYVTEKICKQCQLTLSIYRCVYVYKYNHICFNNQIIYHYFVLPGKGQHAESLQTQNKEDEAFQTKTNVFS